MRNRQITPTAPKRRWASCSKPIVTTVPTSSLYLLNGAEALFGPYEVVERVMVLDDEDGSELDVLDVVGLGSPLTHFVRGADPEDQGSVFVTEMQAWFDSIWNLLAE